MQTKQTKQTNDGRIVRAKMKREGLSMTTDVQEFAMALRTYRLRHELTQEQLGAAWGLSRHTIMRAENCKTVSWQSTYRLFNKLASELRKEEKDEGV